MRNSRGAWAAAGVAAGYAGIATSYLVSVLVGSRDTIPVAVGELVIRLTPGHAAERGIQVLGHHDKQVVLVSVFAFSTILFAVAGWLARRSWWASVLVLVALAVVGGFGVASERGANAVDVLAVVVGFGTWVACLALVTEPLRAAEPEAPGRPPDAEPSGPATRRAFLLRAGAVVAGAVALGVVGRAAGRGRQHVEAARRLLRLPGVTAPMPPRGAGLGLDGLTPWPTPSADFYRVDTSIVAPTIDPADWRLRIHGMVDHEIELTYQDLIDRQLTEAWVTLDCVSNPVGGNLIGNAWWSGLRIDGLLATAGVQDGADAVLQTSDDGWTCGTPLSALTDPHRDAMLAVAMNGRPLPIDHGFPVRTIVPGLYGYVSACKWVVDMKVTRFSEINAFWTQRGWSEQGPVKMSSRIDVPTDGGDLVATGGRVGGMAWSQHTGIEAVEVSVDGGDWQRAELGTVPSTDTWVQWAATIDVAPGDHTLAVRAIDKQGQTQTGEVRDVLPNGSTGWHTIKFTAKETTDG